VETEVFKKLIEKYLNGDTSIQEEKSLFEHYHLLQENSAGWDTSVLGEEEAVGRNLYKNISAQIVLREHKPFYKRYSLAIAASLIFISSFAAYFLIGNGGLFKDEAAAVAADIKPGSSKAVLILADGKKILLDTTNNGEIARQAGIIITKGEQGELIYTIKEGEQPTTGQVAYNMVKTPRGGQYQVRLPDGTKIWLNAASSIKYPTVFTGAERKVELVGEGYFEVAKNKDMPFKVLTSGQEVEVLGTHFNIDSYNDDGITRTTLLEGSVRVAKLNTSLSKLLRPGQQSALWANDITVAEVDTEAAVAWKNGMFMFNRDDLPTVMNKISRWYDVEVDYSAVKDDKSFVGTVSRYGNVSEVLNMLQLTGSVHFKMEGRRITVMP